MKRVIYTFILTIIFSCTFYCTLFAYTFPSDFNYSKAGTNILLNTVQYNYDNPFLKTNYNDSLMDYTRIFGWTVPTYVVGFTKIVNNEERIEYMVLANETFGGIRYNSDGTVNSNTNPAGNNPAPKVINSESTNSGQCINSDVTQLLINSGKTFYYWTSTLNEITLSTADVLFNVYDSTDAWLAYMYEHNYNAPSQGGGSDAFQSGDLPFLSYTLKRQTAVVMNGVLPGATTKEIFNWNYQEKEPYKSDPNGYTFDIIAYANFTNSPNGNGQIFDTNNLSINNQNLVYLTQGGQNISINEFSFLYDDIGRSVWSKSNMTWFNDSINAMSNGYILGIRTCNYNRTQFSWYKLFIVSAGGYVQSTGKVAKGDGNIIDSSAENSNDNMNTTNNGTAGYTDDSNTTASQDQTGTVYDESGKLDISTLIGSLKSLINQIGDLPNLLTQLLTFLPTWFTSMIIISLGLFVTVGLVKFIVR